MKSLLLTFLGFFPLLAHAVETVKGRLLKRCEGLECPRLVTGCFEALKSRRQLLPSVLIFALENRTYPNNSITTGSK